MPARIVRDLGMRIVGRPTFMPATGLPGEARCILRLRRSSPAGACAEAEPGAGRPSGLVLSKQRAGATVRPRNEWHLLDPDVLYWLIQGKPQAEFVETLLTARRVFEPAIAALAARVASHDSLHGIADAYAGMEAAKTAEELLEPDLAFHRRIAEATNNDLLAYIGNMLSLALRESIKLSSKHPNTHALSLPRHKAILTALLHRDPLAAYQASLLQLKETGDDISEILASGLDLR
jgi:DNA-binding FadR family transcriptional regulator